MFTRARRSSALPLTWTADGHAVGGSPTRTFLGSGDWIALDREGDTSQNESEGYSPANIVVNGSNYLEIKAEHVASHGHPYRSGMLQWVSLAFTTGTIEVRVQMPSGTGCWPAIWLLGTGLQVLNVTDANTGHWPYVNEQSDEIDFLEFLGSNFSSNNCQIHADFGTFPASNIIDDGPGGVALGFDASAAFHTYQFIRAAGSLTWKADGATLGTLTGSNVSSTPMFPILNVAMGAQGGSIVDGTLPSSMLVDYFKVT